MALIQCPECGKQISSQAKACPECGLPGHAARAKTFKAQAVANPPPSRTFKQNVGLFLLIILVFLGFVAFMAFVDEEIAEMLIGIYEIICELYREVLKKGG